MSSYFLGVDVGTGSVRAALVSEDGHMVKKFTHPITIHNPKPDYYEQSSENIWSAVCQCVGSVVKDLSPDDKLQGIGFDATCSLVVIGEDKKGLSISENVDSEFDIIMWMDHRATEETDFINKLGHSVLKNVGGKISVEMETPKLLWIKKNLPEVWSKAKHFFDLADYLTWRSTGGSEVRSLCTTVCKWTYQGETNKWDSSYFDQIGLDDLAKNNFSQIGSSILSPGTSCGLLSEASKQQMGLHLDSSIPVAVSMIDAHAGALGLLATREARARCKPHNQLGLICGTSSCHMALSKDPLNVPGVWGPYVSAVLPNYYLSEGGQSAVGSLLDHVLKSHAAFEEAKSEAEKRTLPIQQFLENILEEIRVKENRSNGAFLTKDLHVWPDFHGNRSPIADPTLRGAVSGLSMDPSVQNLALVYLATLQAVAYGTRHIVEQMEKFGHQISVVAICGGLSQSQTFVQTHADVLGRAIIRPKENDSVLLGAAMLGAAAFHHRNNIDVSLEDIIGKMEGEGEVFEPDASVAAYHDAKFSVFQEMLKDQLKYRDIMSSF